MIYVTRLNDVALVVNADLIETIEITPDTIITLTTGKKIVVKEPPEVLISKVIEYKRSFGKEITVKNCNEV